MLDSPSPLAASHGRARLFRFTAVAALVVLATAACTRSENAQVRADAHDAAAQASDGLNRAAATTKTAVDDTVADAKPAVDDVASKAKHGVDDLAIAAGKATQKAGATLERAGDRHRQASDASDNGSN